MIYTVTINPSLDYHLLVPSFCAGTINRAAEENIFPGGKGINVSAVLRNLMVPTTALGFTAGFTGEKIRSMLDCQGVKNDFIQLPEGMSRINVKVSSDSETEINGSGPKITLSHIEALFEKLAKLKDQDIVVLAGSVPASLPKSLYGQIAGRLKPTGAKVVVDAAKELLTGALGRCPFLIKPNRFELGEIVGKDLDTEEKITEAAKQMKDQGAVNVLVSMGEAGAMLLDKNGVFHRRCAPRGQVINSVGAGDSMVAGFLAGYLNSGVYEEAFKWAVCAGSATVFSKGLASRDRIEALMRQDLPQ